MRTCWTSMFPPLRMEMPSLRVKVTIAPSRPDDHKSYIMQSIYQRRQLWEGRQVSVSFHTFAGTDHLKHHLCSSSIMKSGLLVQHLLLLHFLFLYEMITRWAPLLNMKWDGEQYSWEIDSTSNVFSFPSSSSSSSPSAQLCKRKWDVKSARFCWTAYISVKAI